MNKSILAALVCIASTGAFADHHLESNYNLEQSNQVFNTTKHGKTVKQANTEHSFIMGYQFEDAHFKGLNAELGGVTLGYSTAPQQHGFNSKIEYLVNKSYDAEFFGISFGGQLNLFDTNNFYGLAKAGFGYGVLTSNIAENLSYLTAPVELELGGNLNNNYSVFANIGYRFALDLTSEERYAGNFESLTYGAGLRYSF